MMKISVTPQQIALINNAITGSWQGRSERPYWTDGMTSIDASEGFFHGSVFIGSLRRIEAYAWAITSRHGVRYVEEDLTSVVSRFISEYSNARLEGRS